MNRLLFTLFGAFLISPTIVYAGNSSTGGNGAICQSPDVNQGQPILLDLAARTPPIVDLPSGTSQLGSANPKIIRRLGWDSSEITQTHAYSEAMEKLDQWSKTLGYPEWVTEVKMALSRLIFLKAPGKNKNGLTWRAAIPKNLNSCVGSNSHALALYFRGRFVHEHDEVVLIRIRDWNALGPKSQVTALIHLALRSIQLGQDNEGEDPELQQIAAAIALDPPNANFTKDHESFFNRVFKLPSPTPALLEERESVCRLLRSLESSTGAGTMGYPTGAGTQEASLRSRICGSSPITDPMADFGNFLSIVDCQIKATNKNAVTEFEKKIQPIYSFFQSYIELEQNGLEDQSAHKSQDLKVTLSGLGDPRRGYLSPNEYARQALNQYSLFIENPDKAAPDWKPWLQEFDRTTAPAFLSFMKNTISYGSNQ